MLTIMLIVHMMVSAVASPGSREEIAASQPVASKPQRENTLTNQQSRKLDQSAQRALAWLASQQQPDGSFLSNDRGQPAITSLSVLAFLSCGFKPGSGQYSEVLDKAIEYVLSSRQPDGLICRLAPEDHLVERGPSHTATYNHAISGLMLAEVYGMTGQRLAAQQEEAIAAAIKKTLELQQTPLKRNPAERGGWRYVRAYFPNDSDISATSWHLMFLRSARNAGFEVPKQAMDDAVGFVEKCCQFDGRILYGLTGTSRHATFTTVGAGVLSLSLAGRHETLEAKRAGDWLIGTRLPQRYGIHRFLYHAFYYTQGLYQLGGKYWTLSYPAMLDTIVDHQRPDGAWPPDKGEEEWGPCLSTALAVLTISVPYQLLPIYQR